MRRFSNHFARAFIAFALLAVTFGTVVAMGVFQTVAHTACCFVAKH